MLVSGTWWCVINNIYILSKTLGLRLQQGAKRQKFGVAVFGLSETDGGWNLMDSM